MDKMERTVNDPSHINVAGRLNLFPVTPWVGPTFKSNKIDLRPVQRSWRHPAEILVRKPSSSASVGPVG